MLGMSLSLISLLLLQCMVLVQGLSRTRKVCPGKEVTVRCLDPETQVSEVSIRYSSGCPSGAVTPPPACNHTCTLKTPSGAVTPPPACTHTCTLRAPSCLDTCQNITITYNCLLVSEQQKAEGKPSYLKYVVISTVLLVILVCVAVCSLLIYKASKQLKAAQGESASPRTIPARSLSWLSRHILRRKNTYTRPPERSMYDNPVSPPSEPL